MTTSSYCDLYVDSPLERDEFRALVGGLIGAETVAVDMKAGALQVSVRKSNDYDPEKLTTIPSDFVFWRYLVEVDHSAESVSRSAYLEALAQLIAGLRENGARVVAAADFEEDLESRIRAMTPRTVRELGGEIWSEINLRFGDEVLPVDLKNRLVDLVVGVLARHAGKRLENDEDLPVDPLPFRVE